MIQEGHDVGLENPLHITPVYDLVQGAHRVMGTASWPKAIGALQKILLVDGLQDFTHGVLDSFVLERRNPNRPRLALALRDVDTSDRLMARALVFEPCMQHLEVTPKSCPYCSLVIPSTPTAASDRLWR
jgi:hypothetical protein